MYSIKQSPTRCRTVAHTPFAGWMTVDDFCFRAEALAGLLSLKVLTHRISSAITLIRFPREASAPASLYHSEVHVSSAVEDVK